MTSQAASPSSQPTVIRRNKEPSGINTVALATTVQELVDLVVSHTLRLWERSRSDIMLERANARRRPIFSEQDSIPMLLLKECAPSMPSGLVELLAITLSRLIATLEQVLRMTSRTENPSWNIIVGWSALERALTAVDDAHAAVVRATMMALLLGPANIASKAASPAASSSKALTRARAVRDAGLARASDAISSFKLLLSGADVPVGRRIRLHAHSDIHFVEPSTNPPTEGTALISSTMIEYRRYDPADHNTLRRVRDIAALLNAAGHRTTGILPAKGFVPRPHATPTARCEIVYLLPHNASAAHSRTLRAALVDPTNDHGVRHPISERLNLALRITTAVLFLHASGVTHGDIRPENVLLLYGSPPREGDSKANYPWALGNAYLVGVDFDPLDPSRPNEEKEPWWAMLYRHPSELTAGRKRRRSLLNDLYSLGLVLLEIALWRSIVTIEESHVEKPSTRQRPSTAQPVMRDEDLDQETLGRSGSPDQVDPISQVAKSLGRSKTVAIKTDAEPQQQQLKRSNSTGKSTVPKELLKELGLGSPTSPDATPRLPTESRLKYRPNKLAVSLTEQTDGGSIHRLKDPIDMQKVFTRKAIEYIPLVLGERYRDAVLCCLNDGAFGRRALGPSAEEAEEDVAEDADKDTERVFAVLTRVLGLLEEITL
ncbi:hypothetical protein BKA62DRAFT_681824 [Auriculariales sp. MPI-PUGE-AT-0066]|nr:hypothetical protein BKA62DRAFT_681824 [Auriculariales sp. MPI-PUGE-AT-0066]